MAACSSTAKAAASTSHRRRNRRLWTCSPRHHSQIPYQRAALHHAELLFVFCRHSGTTVRTHHEASCPPAPAKNRLPAHEQAGGGLKKSRKKVAGPQRRRRRAANAASASRLNVAVAGSGTACAASPAPASYPADVQSPPTIFPAACKAIIAKNTPEAPGHLLRRFVFLEVVFFLGVALVFPALLSFPAFSSLSASEDSRTTERGSA